MSKKELIKKFSLHKTQTKAYFYDGRTEQSRTLYVDLHANLFVFYNNDLHTFKPYLPYEFVETAIDGKIGAGYSWYR
jgi:hypothetical protein